MRSEEEIRRRMELLKAKVDNNGGKMRKSAIPMLVAAEDALRWALDEIDPDFPDLSMQHNFDHEVRLHG